MSIIRNVIPLIRKLVTPIPVTHNHAFTPGFLVFPVTYRCNLHCKSCFCPDQAINMGELDLTQINTCLKSLSTNLKYPIEHINLTGGELFLRNDIIEIVKCLSSFGAKTIGISTNGLDVEKTCSTFESLLEGFQDISWAIQVSLDGREEIHNIIRGNKSAFKSTLSSLNRLLSLKKRHSFGLGTNMTISKENIGYVKEFYQWINSEYGDSISRDYTFSVNSNLYISSQDSGISDQFDNEEYLKDLREISTWLYREKGDLFALDVCLITLGYERFTPCVFQDEGYFLGPNGSIFKCSLYKESFIYSAFNKHSLEIDEAKKAFENISDKCKTCLNNCGNYIRSKGYFDFIRSDYVRTREKRYFACPSWDVFTPLILRKTGIDFIQYEGHAIEDNDIILLTEDPLFNDLIDSRYYDLRYISIPHGVFN